jgi:glutathionylspermidine synthase
MTWVPLRFGPAVPLTQFEAIQRRMSLECFKWDSQVGDVSTLFPQPLLLSNQTWQEMRQMAERLADELNEAENEMLQRPELISLLGLPRAFHAELARHRQPPVSHAVRILRFDFHYTNDGWRISEVNSDVPGGYTEASCFTEMMAQCSPGTHSSGDPADAWAEALAATVGERGNIALLSAPGFLEDQQVTMFLAHRLQMRGMSTFLLHDPSQVKWKNGVASASRKGTEIRLDGIVRFYQGEWLARLPERSGWKPLLFTRHTLVTNPSIAVLTESKRFPLTWTKSRTNMNNWSSLMPETCDPREVCWKMSDDWVLKAAYANTGDEVYVRELTDPKIWATTCKSVARHPEQWVVQKRFETIPISSDTGALYPCIGVYTINGRACGTYGRGSSHPITNYAAYDIAVLIEEGAHA